MPYISFSQNEAERKITYIIYYHFIYESRYFFENYFLLPWFKILILIKLKWVINKLADSRHFSMKLILQILAIHFVFANAEVFCICFSISILYLLMQRYSNSLTMGPAIPKQIMKPTAYSRKVPKSSKGYIAVPPPGLPEV